ncbi:uncharacterized protein SPPG_00505 [Spizellomyces punctatus DAOM BR117]|uniref:Mitochondrial import receptor subunit tom22 n=1 Tax=Spizellomyces punctatus (strain DAOM BR117) TaxID=645134 RepID=A0A0L0HUK6_SPIPD|nr:uncharacterized protein SPPG_00505 [Spizellomyces punctatus DAOM BR117]KND04803.1 hypothetical protein SPPG_00505 [Spizellomyces punctatus DAOM BR117]|eukprot:XP_016612842.1 hypothetical protein SPPG_00505 [Spizellomyces punctatus DAOM BR117]
MVELTEVHTETHVLATEDALIATLEEDDNDSQYEDEDGDELLSEDDIEDLEIDDEDDIQDESLLERISALVDVVPPSTRRSIVRSVKNVTSATWGAAQWVGSAAWVLATAAMLVGLPVALELEREQFVFQQEAQVRAQQQQAQQASGKVKLSNIRFID